MKTSRSDGDTSRRRTAAGAAPGSRIQSFTCAADLLRAFEHRAFELGCSIDWLLEEAMQRLLAESNEADSSKADSSEAARGGAARGKAERAEGTITDVPPPPPQSVVQRAQSRPAPLPLPPPPDSLPSTLPPPLPRVQAQPFPQPRIPLGSLARSEVRPEEVLVLHYGNERLIVDRARYVIGRSAANADLVIEDGQVSRQHAVIEHTGDGWVITDLGSTNGIVIDGQVVRHAGLREGVVMSIGPLVFLVAAPP